MGSIQKQRKLQGPTADSSFLEPSTAIVLLKLMDDRGFQSEECWTGLSEEFQILLDKQEYSLRDLGLLVDCFFHRQVEDKALFEKIAEHLQHLKATDLVNAQFEDVLAVFRGLLFHMARESLQN